MSLWSSFRQQLVNLKRGYWIVLNVLFIGAIALWVRLWGITFGLPYLYHPDESVDVIRALRMLKTGDFNPRWFHKPSLYLYILIIIYIIYFLYGASKGVFVSLEDIVLPEVTHMGGGRAVLPTQFLAGRATIAILGTLTVIIVYLIGDRYFNHRTGLIAAFFLSISPTHATIHSHAINADIPMTLFLILSFLFSCEVLKDGGRRNYILAGFLGGLATSTKYNGCMVIIPLLLAHWLSDKKESVEDLFLGLLFFGIGFLIGTPYALLDLPTFLNGVAFNLHHYSTGHAGAEGRDNWLWYAKCLIKGEGILPILTSGALVYGLYKRVKVDLLLISFFIPYYLMISFTYVRFTRMLVPLLPFIALLAAQSIDVFVSALALKLPTLSKSNKIKILIPLGIIITITIPLLTTLRRDYLLTKKDVRTLATEWIEHNIPHGSKIVGESYSPTLDDEFYTVIYVERAIKHPAEWYKQEGIDYLMLSSRMYGRFFAEPHKYEDEVNQYKVLFQEFTLVKEIAGPIFHFPRGKILIYRIRD
jgi:4-amino-4-deoxy-L-arabinose transferase-like glycosyltransferase